MLIVTPPSRPRHVPGPGSLVAGRYRLTSKLGGGGMGAVWLATDQLLDREVAVKQVVSTDGMSDEGADDVRTRALREGRMAARLSHTNAIAMHDIAVDGGEPWLVMEYVPSRSVAQILHSTGTLPVVHSAQIGAQVAAAMAAAHAEGIVHRDIKPGNILVATTGRDAGLVKISDFGISRAKDETQVAENGVITGTPAYFAPEVARGAEPTEASDVYSLGATVYTAVEGTPPFGVDEDSLVLLHRVARGEITPPTRAGDLSPVLLAMLEPSPTRRPTMAQARDMLASVAAGPGGNPSTVLSAPLPRSEGGMPIWGGRPRERSGRDRTGVSARTETGLPAARVRPATAHAAQPGPAATPPPRDSAPAGPTPAPSEPTPPSTTPPGPSVASRLLPGAPTPPDSADRTIPLRLIIIGAGIVVLLVVLLLLVL
ncbi:protein kinase domain-containing protein [Williamsia serinedens]|uniref:non-specific serine/threonine protein kinase n=1 Tax=Williamsia serinedens TaxID=391736 RepID=A0ABT1H074_9NOCA|nr:Serine/threonine protein kinase [Williamsia serinedens]